MRGSSVRLVILANGENYTPRLGLKMLASSSLVTGFSLVKDPR